MRRFSVAALLFSSLFFGVGCAPRPAPAYPRALPSVDGGWRTLRAEHHVSVDARGEKGHEQHALRGLIAVERPDRFRLRALGPGGITLFDLLYLHGEVRVIQSLRDPTRGILGKIIESMAGDLAAAFALAPAPIGRSARIEGRAVIIEEPGRTVRLEDFRVFAGKSVPLRITVENRALDYRVTVSASDVTVDEPLDPALFKAP